MPKGTLGRYPASGPDPARLLKQAPLGTPRCVLASDENLSLGLDA